MTIEKNKIISQKGIYQTSIGGPRDALKASTPIEIGRFKKTTGICLNCGASLNLSDRVFTCPSCGYSYDKDVTSAEVIRREGLWNVWETPAEDNASTNSMSEYFRSIPHVKASVACEAGSPKQAVEVQFARAG